MPSHPLSLASPSPHRYDSRGWCNFERAEGQLIKPDSFCIDIGLFTVDMACEEYDVGTPLRIGEVPFPQRTVIELGQQGSYWSSFERGMLGKLVGSGRRAPVAPAAFAKVLATSCSFTSGADSEVVAKLYRKTATALLGSTTELSFERLKWTAVDYQRLGEALPYCSALETLELKCMSFDAAGSAAVQAWVLPPSLKVISLYMCESLTSLPSLEGLTSLESLNLNGCSSLVSIPSLEGHTTLKEINLYYCDALVSLPDLSSLKNLKRGKYGLPAHLEPWRAGGFKAWDLKAQQAGATA